MNLASTTPLAPSWKVKCILHRNPENTRCALSATKNETLQELLSGSRKNQYWIKGISSSDSPAARQQCTTACGVEVHSKWACFNDFCNTHCCSYARFFMSPHENIIRFNFTLLLFLQLLAWNKRLFIFYLKGFKFKNKSDQIIKNNLGNLLCKQWHHCRFHEVENPKKRKSSTRAWRAKA